MVQPALSPSGYSLPSHGVPQMCNTRKGFRQTSPKRLCREPWSGRPFATASKGHVIIQCGAMGIAGLVLSAGFVLLLCMAPQSM
jgi:hypothetical protein